MPRQHAPTEWIDLAKRYRFEAAGSLEPDRKSADPAKEV